MGRPMQARQGTRSASVEEFQDKRIRRIVREEIREALKPIESRLDSLEARFGILEERVGLLEARFGALEERVGLLEKKVDALLNHFGVESL